VPARKLDTGKGIPFATRKMHPLFATARRFGGSDCRITIARTHVRVVKLWESGGGSGSMKRGRRARSFAAMDAPIDEPRRRHARFACQGLDFLADVARGRHLSRAREAPDAFGKVMQAPCEAFFRQRRRPGPVAAAQRNPSDDEDESEAWSVVETYDHNESLEFRVLLYDIRKGKYWVSKKVCAPPRSNSGPSASEDDTLSAGTGALYGVAILIAAQTCVKATARRTANRPFPPGIAVQSRRDTFGSLTG